MNNDTLIDNGMEIGLLSTIVITYKQEKLLFETLDSILSQQYHMIELIVADDATPDFDSKKVSEYINSHQKGNIIRSLIIHNDKNIGTVKNINNALIHSRGEYIKIIAGDDCYPDSCVFANQVKCLSTNLSCKIVIGWIQQCDKDMIPIDDSRIVLSNMSLASVLAAGTYKDARRIIRNKDIFPISVQASCYRRAFFLDYGMCDEKYKLIEDTPLMFKVLEHLDEAIEIKQICVLHRGEVGLSTERGLFIPRREQYHLDNYFLLREEIDNHPEVFSKVERIELPRVAFLFYKLTKNKASHRNIVVSIVDTILHFDAVLYFVCSSIKRRKNKRIV